jgi:hypothetical protein
LFCLLLAKEKIGDDVARPSDDQTKWPTSVFRASRLCSNEIVLASYKADDKWNFKNRQDFSSYSHVKSDKHPK